MRVLWCAFCCLVFLTVLQLDIYVVAGPGFASSTSPDAIEEEAASGGAVMPGSVGTILGKKLFASKVICFERDNDGTQLGDSDFSRVGFACGKNCFALADHTFIEWWQQAEVRSDQQWQCREQHSPACIATIRIHPLDRRCTPSSPSRVRVDYE